MSECIECPNCGEKDKSKLAIMAGGCGQRTRMACYCKSCTHRWKL